MKTTRRMTHAVRVGRHEKRYRILVDLPKGSK